MTILIFFGEIKMANEDEALENILSDIDNISDLKKLSETLNNNLETNFIMFGDSALVNTINISTISLDEVNPDN